MAHPLIGKIERSTPSAELLEFAKGLKLPVVPHKAIKDFGIDWPAGDFTDPKHPDSVKAAVAAMALPGVTRRTVALALNFQRPKTLDRALRVAKPKAPKAETPKAEAPKAAAPAGSRPAKRAAGKSAA